jgi:lipoyl(octanoyl) transferase
MARDEALGELSHRPVLRLYQFTPATLSLGRFQASAGVDLRQARADGLSIVRRPTGGQAVLHDNELTYSVVIVRSHVRDLRKREIYRLVSDILADGLRSLGIEARYALERSGGSGNPDCFATTGEYELATPDGRKIVGSAQATTRRASVQHGSIPLDGSFKGIARYLRAPAPGSGREPVSLGELLGRDVPVAEAIDVFSAAFAARVRLEPDRLADDEEALARELAQHKYGSDEWNLKY